MHRPVLEGRAPLTSLVAELIFGTDDLEAAAALLSAWTRSHLSAPVAKVEQWHWSVGAVAIVELEDGGRIALKAFPPRWTEEFLRVVVTVQRHLAERGLACPIPVVGPVPLAAGRGMVCAERVLTDPGWPTRPLDDRELVVSAVGLARLVTVAAELPRARVAPLSSHPLRTPPDALFPEPHSPLFDFEATAGGAEWIDELARLALDAARCRQHAARRRPHGLVGAQRAPLARRHPSDLRRRQPLARRREHGRRHRRGDVVGARRGGGTHRTLSRRSGTVGACVRAGWSTPVRAAAACRRRSDPPHARLHRSVRARSGGRTPRSRSTAPGS